MQQSSKGLGIYKKGVKGSVYANSNASSKVSEYVQNDNNTPRTTKQKFNKADEISWMGSPTNQPFMKIENEQSPVKVTTFQKKNNPDPLALLGSFTKQNTSPQKPTKDKLPTKLIQDILKGLSNNTLSNTVNNQKNKEPFYSEETQQMLIQLLTNSNKMNTYIEELQSQLAEVPEEVGQNYQILIILLKNLMKADFEVKVTSQKGLQLNFNSTVQAKQEYQIENLEKKIKEKDEQLKQIVEDYQAVIRNFNDVIEKLLAQRQPNFNQKINKPQNKTIGPQNEVISKLFFRK